MKAIVIIVIAYFIIKALGKLRERREAERAEQERRRIREEQDRQRAEIRRQMEAAKEQTRRQIELERQQLQLRREQERQRVEQLRQAQEQERQAAVLARHEDQLAKLEFQARQARRDMDFLRERMAQQYAMMDSLLAQQHKLEPGTKEHDAIQKKIIVLDGQMHTTRTKYAKAAFTLNDAKRKTKRESA